MPPVEHTEQSSSTAQSLDEEAPHNGLLQLLTFTQQQMIAQVNATVATVLESMLVDGGPSSTSWRPKGVKKGVAYYLDDNVTPDQWRLCCVAETSAPAEEIMQLFRMTDTKSLLKNNRVMYDNVLEARILSVLQQPTDDQPFKSVYIRYSCFETRGIMVNRDMCVLAATDVFTTKDGSTAGYCLWDSVDIPECPDYRKTRNIVRSRMFRSGFVFHTVTDSEGERRTKIMYLVGLEAGGTAPRIAARVVMERFGAVVGRLCSYFRRKQLDPATFRPRSEWSSTKMAIQCRGCFMSFHRLTVRHNCVACGHVFCKTCLTKENIDLPGFGIQSLRVCNQCLDQRGVERRSTRANTRESNESFHSSGHGSFMIPRTKRTQSTVKNTNTSTDISHVERKIVQRAASALASVFKTSH